MLDTLDRPHHGYAPTLAIAALALLGLAPCEATATTPIVDRTIGPGGIGVWTDAADIGCPTTATLSAATTPSAGQVEVWPTGLFYIPELAFWSLGQDGYAIRVEGCPGRSFARLRVVDAAWADVQPLAQPVPARRSPIDQPAPSKRIGTPGDNADDGQPNGGSMIAAVDVDDDADPITHLPTKTASAPSTLWRGLASTDGPSIELSLDGSLLRLEQWSDAGANTFCEVDLTAGRHEIAVDWWNGGGAGGGRLSVDGIAMCSMPTVDNDQLVVVTHEIINSPSSAVPTLRDVVVRGGTTGPRLQVADSIDLATRDAGTVTTSEIGGDTWAVVDSGVFPRLPIAAPAGPWAISFGLDVGSFGTARSAGIWQAVSGPGEGWLVALELNRTPAGDQLRLVGVAAAGNTTFSSWTSLQPGPRRLSVQWRPGSVAEGFDSTARLWVDGQTVAELDGLTMAPLRRMRYGLSHGVSGQIELTPLTVWAETR